MRTKNKIHKFLIFIFQIIVLNACENKSDKLLNENDNITYLNKNYTDAKDVNHSFISEFKESMKDEISVPTNFDPSIVDRLKTLEGKTAEEKYKILVEFINVLPKPYYDTPYYKNYKILLGYLDKIYIETAKPIPNTLNFIWLGGPLGDAQIDYLKIWAKVNPDYQIQLWYDPDNLFSYETQKSLKENVDISISKYKGEMKYEDIFAEKVIGKQNELFEYTANELAKNKNAKKDLIRAEFLDKIIYKKPFEKIAEKKYYENLKKMNSDIEILENSFTNLKFKNIRNEISDWNMLQIYEHELDLRFNFAAASDVLRLFIQKRGGVYGDMDLLPTMIPIYELISKNNVLKNYFDLPLAKELSLSLVTHAFFNEIILNNKNLIPSFQVTKNYALMDLKNKINYIIRLTKANSSFKDAIQNLPEEIVSLAKDPKYSELNNLFYKLDKLYVREGEFKIIGGNNSFILNQPVKTQEHWLQQLIDRIESNYLQIFTIEKNNPGLKLPYRKTDTINEGTVKYFRYDGLLSNMDTTISISGPVVYNKILDKVANNNPAATINYLNKIFNSYTPEASVSSWFKRGNSTSTSRQSLVLQLGSEENTQIAASNIFNKLKKNAEKYIVENDKFEKIISEKEKLKLEKLKEMSESDAEYERENEIINDRELNKDIRNKIEIHLVGHSEENNNTLLIGGISAEDMAKKIKSNLFQTTNSRRLDYISIVSCNPAKNSNDTVLLENYSKSLITSLNEMDIPIQIVSVRTTDVRVDKNGDKFYLHDNKYTEHREGDKLYIYRKNKETFLTIKALYLNTEMEIEKLEEVKDNLRSVTLELNEMIEDGASGPLGELPSILRSMQNIYKVKGEASNLANSIKEITDSIRTKNKFNTNYAPLFSTISEEDNSISFIHTKTGEVIRNVELTNEETSKFSSIWNKLNSEMKQLKTVQMTTDKNGVIKNLGEGDGLGITPLILAQTLYGMFKTNNSNKDETNVYDPALGKLIKAQNYLLYSQIGIDIYQKARQTEYMIYALLKTNAITDDESIIPGVSQVVNKLTAARYLTPGFSLAAAALDAFEFSYAVGSQKGIFATQFSFDIINASMSLGSLALGEGVASSVLGYLGTPFAGLAIGFTGFAGAAIEAQEESIQIGKFFNEYLNDHSRYGKMADCSANVKIISLAHSGYFKGNDNNCSGNLSSAVIKKIDFTTSNELKVTYGSHYVYKTKNWHKGIFNSYFSNFQGSDKFPVADSTNKFNLRDALGLQTTTNISIDEDTAVVLPFLMEKSISYGYSYTPGIMTRSNSELDAVNKLSKDRNAQFVFRYFVDLFEYAIRNLHFETNSTDIKIVLDNKDRTLLTPIIPDEYSNKIKYNIYGENGNYTIEVGKNATYNLFPKENDAWIIDAKSLKFPIKYVRNNAFRVGDSTYIYISGRTRKNLTIKEYNKTYQINPNTGKITNIIETEVNSSDQEKFIKELKNLAATFPEHDGIIKVNHFKRNAVDKSAWYDIGKNEIYSPSIKSEKYFNFNKMNFLGKKDNLIYYYDSLSGIVFQQNLLMTSNENTIPLIQVSKNSDPYFDKQHNTLIYKNSESSIPGINGDWEFSIARIGNTRHLLKIDIKENSKSRYRPRLIESLLKVQRSFHISQPVKITDKKNGILAWFIKFRNDNSNGKLITLSSEEQKEIFSAEYAGYTKKKDGKFIYYFTSRDPSTLKLSLFQREEHAVKAKKLNLTEVFNGNQFIISVSIVNNKPVILTSNSYLYSPNLDGDFMLTGINFSLAKDKSDNLSSVIKNILNSHLKHFEVITLTDSFGSLAWYDFKKDVLLLFDPMKKFIGTDNFDKYYFLDEYLNKLYFRKLVKGNLKNYSLEYQKNKLKINLKNNEDELQLQTNALASINLNFDRYEKNDTDASIFNSNEVLEQSFNNFEKREREKALESYNDILSEVAYKIDQDKLDAQVPAGGTKRRSIIFVNDGWYNSSIEIVLKDRNGSTQNFHSWWGQKSNFTVTPLVPISTQKITISIKSYLFGWSKPFFERDFTLAELPLCINSMGTLFNRSAIVKNCNEKY
ncbi:TcdA/TcdB pore-forming domain-containing protein [Pigmentibacter ruber]|uniref:TcdA/TcdB pore-forming domain-containing protein n=1 Tax=Pigmentibacter ruber TaxID=2683196 RepID=UPI00131E3F8A|nr:TcdA/TcdB pore-forming domain-containing protein [Pigmentibacter ruber]